MDIGLSKKVTDEVSDSLFTFLATTYALYLKTQTFHWNVKGQTFFSLHLLFEKQYTEMAEGIDEIAERIATLESYVDGSFTNFNKSSLIKSSKKNLNQKDMLKELINGHEALSKLARPLVSQFQKHQDEVSSDLMIKRLSSHEKAIWMLKSHLSN